ncbi:MAG: TldD/PmbA family protein, partial [Methanobacteriota archaeon]
LSVGRELGKVNPEEAGRKAGMIAKMSVNAKKGKPGRYDVIMAPTVAASIIGANAKAANPFAIEAGCSWLKDRVGTKIGSPAVTMVDDGRVPNGLGSREYDDEGVPTQRTVLVENGILRGLIHNTSTAKRNKTETTGNAGLVIPENQNIVFSPGSHSFEELLEEASQPAIYVTSNWYTRFTSQKEGVFSTIPRDGMFMVEKGELGQPIRELRISDNMLRILANVAAVGREVEQIKWWEVETPTFAPPILVKGVSFTTGTREV